MIAVTFAGFWMASSCLNSLRYSGSLMATILIISKMAGSDLRLEGGVARCNLYKFLRNELKLASVSAPTWPESA